MEGGGREEGTFDMKPCRKRSPTGCKGNSKNVVAVLRCCFVCFQNKENRIRNCNSNHFTHYNNLTSTVECSRKKYENGKREKIEEWFMCPNYQK